MQGINHADPERISHPLEPVYDARSIILILGSMPSPKSREVGFYYGHPQNRFWPVMAAVTGQPMPFGTEERKAFLLRNKIALWDVLASCQIIGADDNSIRDPIANDIDRILRATNIRSVFTTGRKASDLYRRFCLPVTQVQSIYLPSTSPANQAIPTSQLIVQYRKILAENGFSFTDSVW